MEGTFDLMGWQAKAKVIIVPFISVFVDMVVDPLDILGVFQLQTGYELGCSPKASPLNAVYYAAAKTHCSQFAIQASCESDGPRPAEAFANAAAGDVATDSKGRLWKATVRQSGGDGNAVVNSIVWMPFNTQEQPFSTDPQCEWHSGVDEGPHFLLDLGVGGDGLNIQNLASAGVSMMQGELPDIATLLGEIKFRIALSGKVTLLGASASAVMEVNKTHYFMDTNFNNFLGIPSATASLMVVAEVAESPAFLVNGKLGLDDVVGDVLELVVRQLQNAKNMLVYLNGGDGPLPLMAGMYSSTGELLEWIEEDIPLGPCVTAPFHAAKNLMETILEAVPLYADAGQTQRVTTIQMLLTYVSDKMALVSKMLDDASLVDHDLSSIISMSAEFEIGSGDSGSSAMFAFTGTLLGVTATFDASISVGMEPSAIVRLLYTKLMEGCAAFVSIILTGAENLKEWFDTTFEDVKSKVQYSCDGTCEASIKSKWNDVIIPSIKSTAGAFSEAVGAASSVMDAAADIMGLGSSATATANSLLANVNAIPVIAPLDAEVAKLAEVVDGIKTGLDSSRNGLNVAQPTFQTAVGQAQTATAQFSSFVDNLPVLDTVAFDFSLAARTFKLIFKMVDGTSTGFEVGSGRRRRRRREETERWHGRRSTGHCASVAASSFVSLVDNVLVKYVPLYQEANTAFVQARNSVNDLVQPTREAIESIITSMKSISITMPVIKIVNILEMYKCETCPTEGATLMLNTAAVVQGSARKLLASADVYAKIPLLNSQTALTMSAYDNMFDFHFTATNLFGIVGLAGEVAIEWRESNGLQFNFLLDGAGMDGKVDQVIADVRARTDAAKASAQTSLTQYQAAAQNAADSLCATVFSGVFLTFCNSIIDTTVGSVLKVVFDFVKVVLAGALEAVTAIVTSILSASSKIFDMNKLRLHGSLGGVSTSIGAEVDVAVFGVTAKFSGDMNVAELREWLMAQVLATSGTIPPKLRDVAATIAASIAPYANIAQQAVDVAKSAFVMAPGLCATEACPYYRDVWSGACYFICPSGHSGGMWDGGVPNVACADRDYFAYRKTGVCAPDYPSSKKPEYPSEWPTALKAQFDGLVDLVWGEDERRMRKDDAVATANVETEKAAILARVQRIAAADVVASWSARQGEA